MAYHRCVTIRATVHVSLNEASNPESLGITGGRYWSRSVFPTLLPLKQRPEGVINIVMFASMYQWTRIYL